LEIFVSKINKNPIGFWLIEGIIPFSPSVDLRVDMRMKRRVPNPRNNQIPYR